MLDIVSSKKKEKKKKTFLFIYFSGKNMKNALLCSVFLCSRHKLKYENYRNVNKIVVIPKYSSKLGSFGTQGEVS